jgi:hypothetical protein
MAHKHDDKPTNRQMAAAPYGTEAAPHPPPPEPRHYPVGIMPIYILKNERAVAEQMAEMAAATEPPPMPVMQVANVDDPTSPPLRNNATGSAGAYMPVSDVVPPPPPAPTLTD